MATAVEFVIEDGVLVKYKGKGGDIVIPEGVTKIGAEVFRGKKKITGVVVPEGVREIGDFAFCDCIKLEQSCFQHPDRILFSHKGNAVCVQ